MTENADQQWYCDGLKFECTQCGTCCTGAPGVVWVTDEELQDIADSLGKSIGEIRLTHTRIVRGKTSLREFANGDCTFFDGRTRGCQIYESRPAQCRTWPFWKSNLESSESWQETQEGCPGAGSGTLYSLEEIEDRANRIDI